MAAEPLTLRQAMQRALALYERADWAGADALCRAVLASRPDYFDALHLSGVVSARLGRSDDAIALLEKALAIDAGHAETFNHLGVVLAGLGRNAEAVQQYNRALSLEPDDAFAHYNRGNALRDLGRHHEALGSYSRALELKPDLVPALQNRADLRLRLACAADALSDYDHAITLAPGDASICNNRGVALDQLGRHAEALASFAQAIAIQPTDADAHYNHGNSLRTLNRHAESLASYARALAQRADFPEASHNRGVALANLGRYAEAIASYDEALVLRPGYADAWTNRGNALRALKRDAEALENYARALELEPNGEFLFGTWLHAKMKICDWDDIERQFALLDDKIMCGERASPPFPVLAASSSPAVQRAVAETWVAARHPGRPVLPGLMKRPRGDRMRIGYFSANLHEHAMARLMAELFERHDRSKVALTAFSFGPDLSDAMRARISTAFEQFVDVRAQSDEEVALQARMLEIDIAVDLMGFTQDCRPGIFACRAAPLQVAYLGYPGTMGARYIDYVIADRMLIPKTDRTYYSERIAYVPDSYQVNDTKRAIADLTLTRDAAGLPREGFVFSCFNNSYKITPRTFDVWMRLLLQVEGSVLWLIDDNKWASANLRKEAIRRGVAAERLVFAPRVSMSEHLARHRVADLFLDTLPYNAHTTASDALWAGLPVLTCIGETFAGRVAASLLQAIRLPELITLSLEEYAALAAKLANDPSKLRALREKLHRHRRSTPLFDTPAFTQYLENAFRAMYERYHAQLPPEHIFVRRSLPVSGSR